MAPFSYCTARKPPCFHEAAAIALEQLITQHQGTWDLNSKVEVTVHEPQSTYTLHPEQILKWACRRTIGESMGIMALRNRIVDLFRDANSAKPE